jgi:hypothetical protein
MSYKEAVVNILKVGGYSVEADKLKPTVIPLDSGCKIVDYRILRHSGEVDNKVSFTKYIFEPGGTTRKIKILEGSFWETVVNGMATLDVLYPGQLEWQHHERTEDNLIEQSYGPRHHMQWVAGEYGAVVFGMVIPAYVDGMEKVVE